MCQEKFDLKYDLLDWGRNAFVIRDLDFAGGITAEPVDFR